MLEEMITTLNERGARERELRRFLERNINIIKNTLAKVSNAEENLILFNEFSL